MKKHEVNLGGPPGDGALRDAVHIAVLPVVAGGQIYSGDRIALSVDGKAYRASGDEAVGVADPFLVGDVLAEGARFWLFLLPGTIETLRHEWTHPAIDGPGPEAGSKEESEGWLRQFCYTKDCPPYEALISLLENGTWGDPQGPDDYVVTGEMVNFGGDDVRFHVQGMDAHASIPDEFWDHAERVTGKKLQRAKGFSCGC